MFGALRRCSSLQWRLANQTRAASSRSFLIPTNGTRHTSVVRNALIPSINGRSSQYNSQGSRNAATAAAAIENQAEYERQGSPSSSNQQIDQAIASGPATKFQQLADQGLIDASVIKTITQRMGLSNMTQVQSLTINEALKGKDVLAQAKTGTGKTIGFLLPVIQNILKEDPSLAGKSRAPTRSRIGDRASDIRAIVISPTRELAEQIAVEARKIIQDTNIIVQTAVGGTQKGMHMRQMHREGCHILVGTPGRLKDILSDRQFGVQAPRLSAFVLDEADRLLDQGFWPEIQAIQELLPSPQEKDRQTLMFSATVPSDVVSLVRSVMKPDLHYVRTVQDNEVPTHERVPQRIVAVSGLENLLPTLLELCQREIDAAESTAKGRPFKAIVYFGATVETKLAADIFFALRRKDRDSSSPSYLRNTRVYQIHSRLTQAGRTAAADHFRNATSAILMSSDVTARGMDFPGVTHIIQVGLPKDQDTYVHRIGRTARAGQEGEGWLIIPHANVREMAARLHQMPIEQDKSLATATVDLSLPEGRRFSAGNEAETLFRDVADAARTMEPEDLEKAYLALLGVYQWVRDKEWLIESLNRLTKEQWGMAKPPGVARGLQAKLGLINVRGIESGGSRTFGGAADRPGSSAGGYGAGKSNPFGGAERSSPFGGARSGYDRGGGSFDRPRGGSEGGRGGFDRERRGGGGFGRGRSDTGGSRGGFSQGRSGSDRPRGSFDRQGGGGGGGYDRPRRGPDRERSSYDG